MNEPGFLGVTIALLSVALFLTSPLRYRHWSVLAFVLLSFVIVLVGLPAKFLSIVILAAVLWMTAQAVDKWS